MGRNESVKGELIGRLGSLSTLLKLLFVKCSLYSYSVVLHNIQIIFEYDSGELA